MAIAAKNTVRLKKIKVVDIIAAAEANGYKHSRGEWFQYEQEYTPEGYPIEPEDRVIVAACILGQASINLGVDYGSLQEQLDSLGIVSRTTVDWQGRKQQLASPLADAIIEINDNATSGGRYRPYKTVLSFMKKALAPYLDKEIELPVRTYNATKKN